jgi:hypothetical protein
VLVAERLPGIELGEPRIVIGGFEAQQGVKTVAEACFSAYRFAGGIGDSVPAGRLRELVEAVDGNVVVPESLLGLGCRAKKKSKKRSQKEPQSASGNHSSGEPPVP